MRSKSIIQSAFLLVLALSVGAPAVQCQNSQIVSSPSSGARPLNILVLGDSIMWGQGLKPENKSWTQVKLWLAHHTGRPVIERVEAHSGAVIEAEKTDDIRSAPDGEVNVGAPTLREQLTRSLGHYANARDVDLVLVSGCVNDVGARNVLNAASNTEDIRLQTEAKCGSLMTQLLRQIISSFPAAHVIVANYYPFITEKTRNDMFMRALTKKFYKAVPGAERLSQETIFKRMISNSDQWYRSSNKSLGEAVRTVNAELAGTKPEGRVSFAETHFLPDHSFRTRNTRLWDFEISLFRKLLVILSFGKILLRTNDEVRYQRSASCKEFWKAPASETPSQKKERKNEEVLCRYSAVGHPNRQGASVYTEAMIEQLQTMFPRFATR